MKKIMLIMLTFFAIIGVWMYNTADISAIADSYKTGLVEDALVQKNMYSDNDKFETKKARNKWEEFSQKMDEKAHEWLGSKKIMNDLDKKSEKTQKEIEKELQEYLKDPENLKKFNEAWGVE